jgi:hypothetical protein
MAKADLHIVTFAVPFPPHYGGAIDVWNRILALKECGVSIRLHCFVYGMFDPQPILKEVATDVHYYPRAVWSALLMKSQPYIVASRKIPALFENLTKDNHPILFEGMHTTAFVPSLKSRKLLLRAHNIEQQYYDELARHTKGFKALIYQREALCLKDYESTLAKSFDMVFPISPTDADWYASQGVQTKLLPPFHGLSKVDILQGRGKYILYQGDLSLGINQEAILDLLQKIASKEIYPIIVAGRSGSKAFEEKLTRFPNLTREPDVSQDKMIDLIRHAQVIFIHSLHGSGMKLKIFPALYHGRFVAATENSRTNTSLDKTIHFYSTEETSDIVQRLWGQDFSASHIKEREGILSQQPADKEKAEEILRYL